jgi:large subunit ribosomal protein L9
MKVLLLKNVARVGQRGDVKDLSEGYVRNMLIPKGLAKILTPGELKNLEAQKGKIAQATEQKINAIHQILESIKGATVTISEKANDKGHLFAAIPLIDIVSAIASQLKVSIDKDWVNYDSHIKSTGVHPVEITFNKKSVKVNLEVLGK